MEKPVVAQKGPYAVDVTAGEKYFWCACGRSAKQPFCDGTHQGSGLAPVMHVAEKTGTVYFCGCKATESTPFCDGSHSSV